jgi:hypothetical protein
MLSYACRVRRVVAVLSACVCVAAGAVGCGMLAGVDDPYGNAMSLGDDGGGGSIDGTLGEGSAADGASDASSVEDARVPEDVYTPDANEPPPDAAEAGCKNPTGACDNAANACCAPAVCNAVAKCVGKCVSGVGCGNEAACCYGKHCNELFSCQDTCGAESAACNVPGALCCEGFVCPLVGIPKCVKCTNNGDPCDAVWKCCSKNCGGDGKCH